MKVLIVEDEDGLRKMVAEVVSGEGHYVDQADSLQKAIEMIHVFQYDRVLIDRKLGDGDGVTAAELVSRTNPQTKIMLMSGYENDQTQFAFLRKPFPLEELIQFVN